MERLSRRERRLANFYASFCMLGLVVPAVPALMLSHQHHPVVGFSIWLVGAVLVIGLPLVFCKQLAPDPDRDLHRAEPG